MNTKQKKETGSLFFGTFLSLRSGFQDGTHLDDLWLLVMD